MSPEYKNINGFPNGLKKEVLGINPDCHLLAARGFVYFANRGEVILLDDLDGNLEEIEKKARKQCGPHLVWGICGNQPAEVVRKRIDNNIIRHGDQTIDTAEKNEHPKYRGKHRSHTRGTGIIAFLNKSKQSKDIRGR